ncbi:hypothetical protein GCM10025868_43030 [Angustibacter aerolatus]|uniref:CobQ/CobB/MinD/ParA nucleotide binding domain-containing protein n=1 Tax=Angustibacter aerolatus TaxID=1162965 RepID=A0ABQ6JLF1_9ACTN|nr:cobyrinate a,c-diamide synthase [Angustibacter aerolatus]GMA89053.1 hypothetical protein GCM10025868_43030 [Angustibacter aerolatus]
MAAPGSGHGKTTIATGLMAALRTRGLEVSGHKVGPDYIDPGYHAVAHGRHPRNLDPVLQGEHRVAPLFVHGALTPRPADVSVIEGVMGLFDGAIGRRGEASTAHVARLLQAPVVLVVDVSGASRSVAATVLGFARFDPAVRLAGVVLNRVATTRHEDEVREALGSTGVPVLGSLGRDDLLATPSRHLGLVPAVERADEAASAVQRLGERVAAGVDLDAVLRVARSAPPLHVAPWEAAAELPDTRRPPTGRPVRVASAGGAAFAFRYRETDEPADRRGGGGRRRRPAARRGAARRHRRALPGWRVPRGLCRAVVGQRAAAPRRRGRRRGRYPGGRRVRRPALPVRAGSAATRWSVPCRAAPR